MVDPWSEIKVQLPAASEPSEENDVVQQFAHKCVKEIQERMLELLVLRHRAEDVKETQLRCQLTSDSRVRITGDRCNLTLTELEKLWTPFRNTCTGLVVGFKDKFIDVHFREGTAAGSTAASLTDVQKMQLCEKKRVPLSQLKDLLMKPDEYVAPADLPRMTAVSCMVLRVLGQGAPRELRVEVTEKTDSTYVLTCSGLRCVHLNDLRTLVGAEKLGISELFVSLDKGTLAVHVSKTTSTAEPAMWMDTGFYAPFTSAPGSLMARRDAHGRLFKRQRTDVV